MTITEALTPVMARMSERMYLRDDDAMSDGDFPYTPSPDPTEADEFEAYMVDSLEWPSLDEQIEAEDAL
jgi:hypothetical protein